MEQRSSEWFQAKIGKIGASRVVDICKGTRGSYTAARKNLMAELICQILTGEYPETFTSAAMQWGVEWEPVARSAYEAKTGRDVNEVGFIDHPTITGLGASPDGLCIDRGIEIKCPNTATHIETLTGAPIDRKYMYQMQCGMMCTGMLLWDFISYDPRLPYELQLHITRVERDDEICAEIETEAQKFMEEMYEKLDELKGMMNAM